MYMKYCRRGLKRLQASAFRNGSQSVATALSSLHNGHEWEGSVLKPSEHAKWLENNEALRDDFFQQVDLGEGYFVDDEDGINNTKQLLNELLDEKIAPFTLRQGTADWHQH